MPYMDVQFAQSLQMRGSLGLERLSLGFRQ